MQSVNLSVLQIQSCSRIHKKHQCVHKENNCVISAILHYLCYTPTIIRLMLCNSVVGDEKAFILDVIQHADGQATLRRRSLPNQLVIPIYVP